jgi:protein SCO1/2
MKRSALAALVAVALSATPAGARPGPFGIPAGPAIGEQPPLPSDYTPPELEGIEIEDRRGARLPADLVMTDHRGQRVRLGDYLDGKPLVLVLAYYGCPSLCSAVLNELMRGMQGVDWSAGKEYRTLVVSFDPRDTPSVAAGKREAYVDVYGRDVGEHGFDFLVSDEATVKILADAVGFPYRWIPKTKEFAHAAGAFVFTNDGRLSRTLYGLNMGPRDLRLSLVEASQGKLGSLGDKILFYCFKWDRHSKTFVIATWRILKGAAGLTVIVLGTTLFLFWRRERRRNKSSGVTA